MLLGGSIGDGVPDTVLSTVFRAALAEMFIHVPPGDCRDEHKIAATLLPDTPILALKSIAAAR
jgi:hypothetical protein